MSLYKRFIEFSEKEKLFNKKSKVLIALSGGIDSVVLLHLLHSLGLKTGVAHCNFMLRENESDEDEMFCKNTAQKYNVDFYCKHFETAKYAKDYGVSIQMAARELRYEWLEDTRINNGYDLIATGAHFDDSIETFFINLSRGSGIAGLIGIKPKNNKVIRPLLFAAKADVLAYAKKNRLKFREDSSNQSDKYQRNALRNKIIPVFETISLLGNSEKIIDDFLEQKRELLTQKISSGIIIDKKLLKREKHKQPILYEFISTYGFNKHQTEDIIRSINSTETQIFYSKEYGLIVDRLQITVSIKKTETKTNFAIPS
jgi:tRNA(Ile)-lysidine synthase